MNSYAKCLLPRDTHFNEPVVFSKAKLQKHTNFCKMFVPAYVKSLDIFQFFGKGNCCLQTASFVYTVSYHTLYICII